MSKRSLYTIIKERIPKPVRFTLRFCLNYSSRIGRWFIILWQIRGLTGRDQLTLFFSALASPLISFSEPLKWQDPFLLADVKVNVPSVGRFHLRQKTDDLWHVLPWREKAIFKAISKYLRPGDVFIDAGANIGVYTVFAAKIVGPSGRVISVEMMPNTAKQLEQHIYFNGLKNVTIVKNANSGKKKALFFIFQQ